MTKKIKNVAVTLLGVLALMSCSSGKESISENTSTTENKTSETIKASETTKASETSTLSVKSTLVKAFYEYTLSQDGYDLAESNGGIVAETTYAQASTFNTSNYGNVFSLDNSSITINVGGSTSVEKISKAQINAFKSLFTGKAPNFSEDRQGSGTAVEGLSTAKYDIGYLSRELKDSELTTLNGLSNGSNSHFAIDAVVAVVNPKNTLSNITREQLALMYGSSSYLATLDSYKDKTSIDTWNQVDSSLSNTSISKYTRDSSSGTRECFMEKIGIADAKKDDKLSTTGVSQVASNGAMISAIEGDVNGIGYCSLDSVASSTTVKMLSLEGVTPSVDTVVDSTYALQRYFNIVVTY